MRYLKEPCLVGTYSNENKRIKLYEHYENHGDEEIKFYKLITIEKDSQKYPTQTGAIQRIKRLLA